jgi:Transmembrane domain of unknown function (DUF3566)
MSTPEDDLTAEPGADSVRVDAPTAVSWGEAAAPVPPKRSRAPKDPDVPKTVAASLAVDTGTDPVAEVQVVERPERPRKAKKPGPRPVAPRLVGPRTNAARGDRSFRQTVTKIDLWSVTKLSLCFYLSAMFVTLVALIALWMIADAAGIIHSIEKFFGDLLSAKDFHFLSGEVLRGTILIGLVVVALAVVVTVVAVSFYNIFAELFGGVEITVKEEGEVLDDE